jgi:hypothetical protein
MTGQELKAKRLSLGFRSRNVLAKRLGVTIYAVEHSEYGRRAVPNWVPLFCIEWKPGNAVGIPPPHKAIGMTSIGWKIGYSGSFFRNPDRSVTYSQLSVMVRLL